MRSSLASKVEGERKIRASLSDRLKDSQDLRRPSLGKNLRTQGGDISGERFKVLDFWGREGNKRVGSSTVDVDSPNGTTREDRESTVTDTLVGGYIFREKLCGSHPGARDWSETDYPAQF